MNEQNSVYERIEALCRSHGINITEMCKLCSIPRAIMTDFKMGRNKSLSAENLRKISEHFSCSVEYLLSGELTPPDSDSLKVGLFGGIEGVTDEMLEEVLRYAAFVRSRENGDQKAL